MSERIRLSSSLPVGAMDTRASGWWAMIFTVFTEASLFSYLLFSYYYLAVQPHLPGTFPEGGQTDLTLAIPNTLILLASSVAVGWAQLGIEHGSKWRLVWGLGAGAGLGLIFLVIQIFECRSEAAAGHRKWSDLFLAYFRHHWQPYGACGR